VVGTEEGVEAQVLGGLGDGEQGVVGGPLLGLGEDSKVHTSILHAPDLVNLAGTTGHGRPRSGENRLPGAPGAARPVTGPGGDRWAVGAGRSGARAEEAVMSEELGSAGQRVGSAGRPKGLLEELEELMAALNADLSALTDLPASRQSSPEEADLG
jgi:hypothetical protein